MRLLAAFLFFSFVITQNSSAGSFIGCCTHPAVYVRSIEITGHEKTKEFTIRRELQLDTGRTCIFDLNRDLENSRSALVNLNLFNQVEIDTVWLDSSVVKVKVHVVEKWYVWPLPFIEFADRNFNQWYQLDLSPDRTNYGLYLFKYNNFGRNQTMKLSLVFGYTDLTQLEYRIPYLPKYPKLGIEAKLGYRRNHEIWLTSTENKLQFLKHSEEDMIKRLSSNVKLSYRPSKGQNFVSADVGYQKVNVHDSVVQSTVFPNYLLNNESENELINIGLEYTAEGRNNKLFPTRGSHLAMRMEEQIVNGSHFNVSLDLDASTHIRIKEKSNVGLAFRAQYNSGDSMPYFYLPALGYNRLVRGFEDYVVTGYSYSLSQIHYKYRLYRGKHRVELMPLKGYKTLPLDIYASVHFDGAYVNNNASLASNDLENNTLLGYGVGIDMLFYLEKLLRIDYSFANNGTNGLYLHFKKAF